MLDQQLDNFPIFDGYKVTYFHANEDSKFKSPGVYVGDK